MTSKASAKRSGRAASDTAGQPMTGGMAIVEQLIANHVDTVFGLPGAQLYPLFDALQQRADRIRTFGARHEQTCGYMAFGAARASGKPAVFAVVPGPGVLNAMSALAMAKGTCTPVLCLTGQVPSQFLGRDRGHLHELPDQLGTLRSIVKWAARIERPADAPELINEAFRQMLSGRPGPVALEMCWDTMGSSGEVQTLPAATIPKTLTPSAAEIAAAAAFLVDSKAPMIFVGSGALDASAEITALAEALDAPVAAFRGGRGVVASSHPLGVSSWCARKLWPETDVAIAIGTRAELPLMRWTGMMQLHERLPGPQTLIRIDIDPAEMRRVKAEVGIVADAADGARALLAALKRSKRPSDRRSRDTIAAVKSAARRDIEVVQPQLAYLDVIRAALPSDGIMTTELSQVGFTAYFGYDVEAPRTYVSEGFQGTLGHGFLTALGVKAAMPAKPVVCITGDGGFLFGANELATAKQEGIALVTLLFNNASYGNVMRDQHERFGNRIIGATLENPDFVAYANAFGVAAHRVTSPAALEPVLKAALKSKSPTLIEVVVPQGSETSPWDFIHPK